jgi:hypothetical protein
MPGPLVGRVAVAGSLDGPSLGPEAVPLHGPVNVGRLVNRAIATGTRLRISHATQDACNIRLQHVNNSHPDANANHPQPQRQADEPSSLSRRRTRWWMSSRMGRTPSSPRPAGSGRSQSR